MSSAKSWLDRTDPRAAKLAALTNNTEHNRVRTEAIEAANRAVFIRECQRDGIDPKGGVSPSLLKLIKGE